MNNKLCQRFNNNSDKSYKHKPLHECSFKLNPDFKRASSTLYTKTILFLYPGQRLLDTSQSKQFRRNLFSGGGDELSVRVKESVWKKRCL